MSDQKPSHGDTVHVVNFLNRPTAVITGTETLARRLRMAVVYLDMTKISRGHYNITVNVMADDAALTQPFFITDKYFKLLENTIKRDPSIWLWTHNRWKNPIPGYPETL
jgi:KDO2-lipid IV(A) lauroyltransferase